MSWDVHGGSEAVLVGDSEILRQSQTHWHTHLRLPREPLPRGSRVRVQDKKMGVSF